MLKKDFDPNNDVSAMSPEIMGLREALQSIWTEGPRAWSDSCHIDPEGSSSSTVIADAKLAFAAEDIQGPVWNLYYPWVPYGAIGRKFVVETPSGESLTLDPYDPSSWETLLGKHGKVFGSRVQEVLQVYQLAGDLTPAQQTNRIYLKMLDLLFGLEQLERIGMSVDFLVKRDYRSSPLPVVLGKTLAAADDFGLPVAELLHVLCGSGICFKEWTGVMGYVSTKKGDFVKLNKDGEVYCLQGKSVRYAWEEVIENVCQTIIHPRFLPSSYAIDLAHAIANVYGSVPVWHAGNSHGGVENSPLAVKYHLSQNQLFAEDKDKHPLVIGVNGDPLNLAAIYILKGGVSISLLLDVLKAGHPFSIGDIDTYYLK